MRRALAEGDSVYGYFDISYMGQPRAESGKKCLISLANGSELQVLSAQTTVLGVWHSGRAALAVLQSDKADDDLKREQVMEVARILAVAMVEILKQFKRNDLS